MDILGLSFHYHDSAAALLRDGRIEAAAQEERFSRKKHDYSFPQGAVDFCLEHAGIRAADLDYVVFYEKPLLKFDRILQTTLHTFPRSWRTFGEAMIAWLDEKLWVQSLIEERLGVGEGQILFTEHHLSHAASAFFCSPFEEAAFLTVDGVGEWATATAGVGHSAAEPDSGNELQILKEQRFPHSLGLLYSAFTAWLGFRVNNGEYKVMGMASYGEPRYQDRVRELIDVAPDGSFRLDMSYFSFHHSPDRTYSPAFTELFGEGRTPDSDFVLPGVGDTESTDEMTLEHNQYYADVAASVQRVTEETILRAARELHRETGLDHLCMAGGVALNSVANGRILRESEFDHLFVQPAASDAGGALGAALYVWHCVLGESRREAMDNVFLGQQFAPDEIRSTLDGDGVEYQTFGRREQLIDRVAHELADGKVVAWFQGRFEWGPRALGNRSILADPRDAEMKDTINRKVKFREPFRPFAPVIPADQASSYFEDYPEGPHPKTTDFMLAVLPWKTDVRDEVAAVDHQGTGRLQAIRRSVQPDYYDLIERFGEITGTPVLVNTSFNLRGQPIVSTPEQALATFRQSGIDLLVLEDALVRS